MSLSHDAALKDLRARYRRVGRWASFHMNGRFKSCPMDAVEAALPRQGWIASLGCGNGAFEIYAALRSPERRLVGVDPNATRIEEARTAGQGLPVEFATGDVFAVLEERGLRPAAFVVNDVFYLIPLEDQAAIVRRIASALAPGGHLLLKDMDRHPRKKYAWNWFQETLACRVLRFTHAEAGYTNIRTAAGWRALLEKNGFQDVAEHPLHRGYLHPHLLVTGRSEGEGSDD